MIRTIAASALIGVALGTAGPGAGESQSGEPDASAPQSDTAPEIVNWSRQYPERYGLYGRQVLVITGCVIEGRGYPAGSPKPEDECRVCQPGTDLFNWTAAPADTACEGGGTCGKAGTGCVSADAPGLTDEFVGNPWEMTNVDTIRCSDGSSETSPPRVAPLAFTAAGADRIQAWSAMGWGCAFTFNVRGATASLSNGPVACLDRDREIIVTAYTATVTENRGLAVSTRASETFSDGITCTVVSSGSGTR